MYTTTFYSFKGGVGRTLALVNVGVELANTGKKVLLVDFDLEAPGIDTFEELRSPEGQAGIVDFVCDYVRTESPPSFNDYRYQAPLDCKNGGSLWVMPAGRRDPSYAAKLASIDWQDLYTNKNGFLLLEDLKAQWAEELKPDYVLIDSRTGHTEVGGICTRQLPDTVVALFIPNEQNLSGLVGVVGAIRSESMRSNRQPINLEFVASNVPSLDDEEEILKKMMRKFSKALKYEKALIIDRYDSLHLLNQSIFVSSRPRSRLTKLYRALLRRITRHNLEDREAALMAMAAERIRTMGSTIDAEPRSDSEIKIKEIISKHPEDAEILCAAARFCCDQGQWNVAETLFEKAVAVAKANHDPQEYQYALEAISFRISNGNQSGAVKDILELLELESIGVHWIGKAIKLLQQIDPEPPECLARARSFQCLKHGELGHLASRMNESRKWQRVALSVLFRGGEMTPSAGSTDAIWMDETVLAAIGLGHFELAIGLLRESAKSKSEVQMRDQFNLAMATWGATRDIPTALFANVVALDAKTPDHSGNANYEQCLALAEFLTGNFQIASQRIAAARRIASEVPFESFSCWQYLLLTPKEFLKDVVKMEEYFSGSPILPEFMAP